MKKEKEEMLIKLRGMKQIASNYLEKNNFSNYIVKDVIRYNKTVELKRKNQEQNDKFYLYVVKLENTNSKTQGDDALEELEFLEDENGNVYTITELIQEYEGFGNIRVVVDETEKREEEKKEKEKNEESEKGEELKKDSLEELEEEKKKETENEQEGKMNKKRKPKQVIERINPDKAEMDYWQTVKQAFNLPGKVDTLAFAYPISSEDKVDYANITVYMLDKDGYIIDDLKVDDYFEFDSSTGNNPMEDSVRRHEKDENNGRTQMEDNRTMIRLKAKNSDDKNTYISLEQKNSVGDYNDINAGRKIVAGTQNIEKQLETDHVSVWDSEVEMLMKSNAGRYNMNEIFEEARKHEEHGEDEYVHREDADGIEETFTHEHDEYIPGTNILWREFANSCGYRGEGDIEHAKEIFNKRQLQEKGKGLTNEEIAKIIVEESEQDCGIPILKQ